MGLFRKKKTPEEILTEGREQYAKKWRCTGMKKQLIRGI